MDWRKDKTIRSERVPWECVERSRRKGYLHRDFFVGICRYQHFATGADEKGLIRYGFLVGGI